MDSYPDDKSLVAACVAGDRRAQEVFYRRYAPTALVVCRRYSPDREEAMALLNGGMMKVFEKLATFRWEGSLEGWVKRLVFRSTIDQFRGQPRRPTLEVADWDQPTEASATHSLYADDLCRIIDMLPETSKEVFWLFAVEGFNHAEIAERLQFSEGNSRWHLNKARQILREKLQSDAFKINRYAG
ncbi:sigma-70 family RNA polymerase sigma factor [Neolewinella lacunae]|uniref:Sigma-70 family RNA polymerase sigma factor n=1 Tax=Neolewinella lacunae TaxID=1517758 RepID=A0A923T8K8_9BACT|nr:sigma-70 family RNA polymerase sigma factor [Neolewinella lacunae]MBC6994661.1 sigma-70 family RNA polymerase sigma factor [Neolewinella lacunae]MDN3634533.1 sigma-70 family RNA polymerase sigma factor [Neolewinella lacunae]